MDKTEAVDVNGKCKKFRGNLNGLTKLSGAQEVESFVH